MTNFILNNERINTSLSEGETILDFVRYQQRLTGTKIGCREGDCGACTVLVGSVTDGKLSYQIMTSCLMPIGNAQGKHIVTIEGINAKDLNPIQQAIIEEGGTQCGFCTIGFIMSLMGFCLNHSDANYKDALAAIDGNICRCTGYKSIERAAESIVGSLNGKDTEDVLAWLVEKKFLPSYFLGIKSKLEKLPLPKETNSTLIVGGGTDLFVQKPEFVAASKVSFLLDKPELKTIQQKGNICTVGGSVTVEELRYSEVIQKLFPKIMEHTKLVSSTPIRNMATLAGNFVNASPIGDMTVFFLALGSSIKLQSENSSREIKLKDFYKGYKDLDKKSEEIIESLSFEIPTESTFFNFEKVSKRTHLDIATVNSAVNLTLENNVISRIGLSVGGVAAIPLFLNKTCQYLLGKEISVETVKEANEIAQQEISPIGDARGSESYKRLLARQLIFAHFIELFPEKMQLEDLLV